MEIKLTLALPRDELTVPVVRRVLREAMGVLGVTRDIRADIEVALTEACTNVLDHAVQGDDYEVSAGIDGAVCVIEVVDRGQGFDPRDLGHADAAEGAEEGRGIQLMRALVDKVEFTSRPQVGTVVHLEKALQWDPDSAIKALTVDQPAVSHGPWSQHEQLADAPRPRGEHQ